MTPGQTKNYIKHRLQWLAARIGFRLMKRFLHFEVDPTRKTALCEIMERHTSDKSFLRYTPFYEKMFAGIRDQNLSLLEIGIGSVDPECPSNMAFLVGYRSGASLRAWKEYFSNAVIFGIDYDEKTCFSEDRIITFHGDSTDPKSMEEFKKKYDYIEFDIIIDDGLHTKEAQKSTLRNLLPHLRQGGYYVIEDIVTSTASPDELMALTDPDKHICSYVENTGGVEKNYDQNLFLVQRKPE